MVLMIVSGRSGSGKSVALRALEDNSFFWRHIRRYIFDFKTYIF